uniref:C-type lectin domain-containing protein n=1 Tax=Pygocentrus nattereri TaxID=42514 RepID=A0AAR2J1M5_PYGNA
MVRLLVLLILGTQTFKCNCTYHHFKNAECQDGWLQYGPRCFKVFTTAATWNASEQNCVNMEGHLASVHSSEEYTFIQDLLNATNSNTTWLGGTDAAQEEVWVWTDGSAFNYPNCTSASLKKCT